jgi:hypothetical protein
MPIISTEPLVNIDFDPSCQKRNDMLGKWRGSSNRLELHGLYSLRQLVTANSSTSDMFSHDPTNGGGANNFLMLQYRGTRPMARNDAGKLVHAMEAVFLRCLPAGRHSFTQENYWVVPMTEENMSGLFFSPFPLTPVND